MVRDMGTFDDWQAQKDSQYLTLTDYITELAKAENNSIKATLYLINHKENLNFIKSLLMAIIIKLLMMIYLIDLKIMPLMTL